jgi:hypothetical protein
MGRRRLALLALGLGFVGCGSSDDKDPKASSGEPTPVPRCEEPTPCGGDPVGTWTIEVSCLGELVGTPSCAGLMGDSSGITQTGTLTLFADHTYSSTTNIFGIQKTTYPAACIAGLDCATLATVNAATAPAESGNISCTATSAGGCSCTSEVSVMGIVDHGTYSTSGDILTQVRTNSNPFDVEYCVRGRSLTLLSRNPSSGSVAQVVTLSKQ